MIGICDSGLGGLLLLENIHLKYPHLNILYYGDQKNMPYGNKTNDEIKSYFNDMYDFFKARNCDEIIVGCNSMCSVIDFNKYDIKVNDIIKKTVNNLNVSKDKKVIIFSTALTKRNGRYIKELKALGYDNCLNVELINLTSLIEDYTSLSEIKAYLYDIFNQLDNENVGAIILGCTHYPIVKELFYDYYKVPIFDSNHLDFKLNDKNEGGRIIIHMNQSAKLDKFMKEYVKLNYEYDKGCISV